jgi:hypothetical protein
MPRILAAVVALIGCLAAAAPARVVAQTDLDAFMKQVVARRDDNWKKLQQYILDERETFELRGPTRLPIWGQQRDYTWYIREGFFVRSPVRFNGVAIGDDERKKFEDDYLARMRRRERRGRGSDDAQSVAESAPADVSDVGSLISQTREPQFISSAYFLRFKFEEGKYALVGRETLDGRDVLRIEYFPTRMFTGTDRRRSRDGKEPTADDRARDAAFQRLMNKVALVTLWIEPKAHQILKYTFDNVGLDFLPAQWLVHVSDVKATMKVTQAFPDVWLPDSLDVNVALMMAFGQFDLHYGLDYHDYRQPDVTTKVGIKEK